MIHKMVIALCLLLALATLVIGVASYRGEIVCRGKRQGLTLNKDFWPVFVTPNDYTGLTASPRTSFANGTFLHLWTTNYTGTGQTFHRVFNGVVFRWRQSQAIFVRSDPSATTPMVLTYSGMLMNVLCIPLWAPFVLFLLYPVLFFLFHGPLVRRRRRKRGLCIHCAYNLTGNVSGICPECGIKICQPHP